MPDPDRRDDTDLDREDVEGAADEDDDLESDEEEEEEDDEELDEEETGSDTDIRGDAGRSEAGPRGSGRRGMVARRYVPLDRTVRASASRVNDAGSGNAGPLRFLPDC